MRTIIYKSKYSWTETIKILESSDIEVVDEYYENNYYSVNQFVIGSSNENDKLKLTIKPFFKKRRKDALEWQRLLEELVKSNDNSLNDFMPERSYTFDSIVIMKQPGTLNNNVYLITFGQAYHDINELIDHDFGIDFAERTISSDNVTTKNVNFFQQSRLKEITNYRRNNADFARPTESYTSISGYPEDKKRYGKKIHCSLGVSFLVPSTLEDFKSRMCELINDIDEIISTDILVNPFPRLKVIKSESIITNLDKLLLMSLIDTNNSNIVNVDLSRLIEIQNFIFYLDEMNQINLFIKGDKNNTKTSISNSESYQEFMKRFLLNNEIEDINNVQIEIIDSEENSKQLKLKTVLHAEVKDQEKDYLLQNGNWGTFNQEYFDLLNKYLDQIEIKNNLLKSTDIEFNKTEEDYIEKFQNFNSEDFRKLHKQFITPKNENFVVKGNGIELADLYSKSKNELFAVKKGVNTSLSLYSLEQSILAMNAIQYFSSYDFSNILSVLDAEELQNIRFADRNSIIWMLPLKKSDNSPVDNKEHTEKVISEAFDLKGLGSVLLKNKLVEWAIYSIENRLRPTIYMECPVDISK